MNCAVSSIQPWSSTAPACRNISQGERAWRAPAASAAARDPSNAQIPASCDVGDPLDHAGIGAIHQHHLADHAGRGARHQRRQRGDRGLLDAFGGDDDAQHGRVFDFPSAENAALLSPCHVQISLGARSFLRQSASTGVPGSGGHAGSARSMFLICSQAWLYSRHEPSILTCPQAPAGHDALRAGGCAASVSGTGGGNRARAAARARRAIQRQRPLRGRGARRLRRRLAEPRRIAAVQDHCRARHRAQGHHPQRLARYRLRPLDQSLSGLRAWLRVLLRPADPCLSRPVAGTGFRVAAVRKARRAGAAGEGTGGARTTSRA